MGAIADAFVAYAQPLIDSTDGSFEQVDKALKMSQFFYMCAQMPQDELEEYLSKMKQEMELGDEEFAQFRSSMIDPMIDRYDEVFSPISEVSLSRFQSSDSPAPMRPRMVTIEEKRSSTDRYGPCPCDSGRKYKFCCGKKEP